MSRYVDLNGLTWDGTPIYSKIQEVKTSIGYMSAITTGWLYGDNVPHIDLAEHDAEVKRKTIEALIDKLPKAKETDVKISYNGALADFILLISETVEQMKGKTE